MFDKCNKHFNTSINKLETTTRMAGRGYDRKTGDDVLDAYMDGKDEDVIERLWREDALRIRNEERERAEQARKQEEEERRLAMEEQRERDRKAEREEREWREQQQVQEVERYCDTWNEVEAAHDAAAEAAGIDYTQPTETTEYESCEYCGTTYERGWKPSMCCYGTKR